MSSPSNVVDRARAGPAGRPWLRFTFGLRGLLAAVLGLGIGCGFLMRAIDQQRRRASTQAVGTLQRETTFLILNLPDPIVRRTVPVLSVQGGSVNFRSDRGWGERQKTWVDDQGKRRDLINIEVSGGGDLDPAPIVIEDRGGELNAHFIGRLAEAYRAKKWAYRVVRAPRAQGQ